MLSHEPAWSEALALHDSRQSHNNYGPPPAGLAPPAPALADVHQSATRHLDSLAPPAPALADVHQSTNRHLDSRYGAPPPPGLAPLPVPTHSRADPNRQKRGSPNAPCKVDITRSFQNVMDDMLAVAKSKSRVEVFPCAAFEERAEDSYAQQLNWLLSDFGKNRGAASGANPQDLPTGAASGANPQDLPSGAASGANQQQQKHWLGRRFWDSHMLQKLLMCTLQPAKAGQHSQWFARRTPSLLKCMRQMPDVKYLGYVEVAETEFAQSYGNDKGRLLKDMFERHDGELAVITRDVTNDVVVTPQLPWLMDSRIYFFP